MRLTKAGLAVAGPAFFPYTGATPHHGERTLRSISHFLYLTARWVTLSGSYPLNKIKPDCMKIIIPMAGRGSRLRPHTLTVPKPLVPVVGKPIVKRIVEDFNASFPGQIDEVAFIIGNFGAEAEATLQEIAAGIGAKASIYHQDEPLGPAHAIYCAHPSLQGPCLVAFADTLFRADFAFDPEQEGMVWVQKVEDPSSYGVVKLDDRGIITDFVEKSPTFLSDLAIVGIYYFQKGESLRHGIRHIIDNDIRDKGEFQITTVLENMKNEGTAFRTGKIDEWLDCGNHEHILYTQQRILEIKKEQEQLHSTSAQLQNAQIIEPCFLGRDVQLQNCVVGPYVSIGCNSRITNCVIRNSIIQENSTLEDVVLDDSIVGNEVNYRGQVQRLSIGDYTRIG